MDDTALEKKLFPPPPPPSASRIVVIDIQQKRLDEARRFGATDVIDSQQMKPVEAVRDLLPKGASNVDFVGLKLVAEQPPVQIREDLSMVDYFDLSMID